MRLRRLLAGFGLMASALAVSACSNSSPQRTSPTQDPRAAAVQKLLPPGFSFTSGSALPSGPANLQVAPDPSFQVSQVHAAAVPQQSQLRLIDATVIDLDVAVTFRPLFVSGTTLQPGGRLTIAAARLPATVPHDVLFILQGPGYRGDHLVSTAGGVAVGIATLPAQLSSGTWYVVVEDTSQLTADGTRLGGHVLAEATVFTVH